jgi:hypothetical protein
MGLWYILFGTLVASADKPAGAKVPCSSGTIVGIWRLHFWFG